MGRPGRRYHAVMAATRGPVTVTGQGRDLATGSAGPVRLDLGEADFTLTLSGTPLVAAFRDVSTIAVQQGQLLLVLGDGAARFIVDGLGDRLGLLLGELRDRRARQVLADRFIELDTDEAIELVEYRTADDHGVAQLAYHGWGVALLPLDERRPWRLVRRASIENVAVDVGGGTVRLAAAGRPGSPRVDYQLAGLGAAAESHAQRLGGRREAALEDAARIIAGLLADAPFDTRRRASAVLVDGRPVDRATLAEAWPVVEAAVLSEPTFAAAYRTLLERGGGPSWLAVAPLRPGESEHRAWFFVGLPGNLVAMEIVTAGAHATYLFAVTRRGEYRGQAASELAAEAEVAVADVSEALIDMRFLRSPIYLTPEQLAAPSHMRARQAIAALPSLQAARRRFVGRLIHRDEESWARSLDDAIAWHAAARDDEARWMGGASEPEEEDDPIEEPS
jgi:hypothetical protein